jgi:hypothetical protein
LDKLDAEVVMVPLDNPVVVIPFAAALALLDELDAVTCFIVSL